MKILFKSIVSKKFLIFAVFSLLLSAVLVVNITTALFFNSTSTSTLITISNLDITSQILNQPDGKLNIGPLIPTTVEESITRQLQINNAAGSEDAYVRIQAIFEIDNIQTNDVQMQIVNPGTNWVTIGGDTEPFWFYYTSAFSKNSTIEVNLRFVVFSAGIGNEDSDKPYKITLKVHAIQTANNGTNYSDATWPEV